MSIFTSAARIGAAATLLAILGGTAPLRAADAPASVAQATPMMQGGSGPGATPGQIPHDMPGGMMSHDGPMGSVAVPADGPAVAAYKAAAAAMHRDMAIAYTGNADVDFVRGMIPHHEGAVAMAKIELAFGHDPEIRKLAEAVVSAQEQEIAFMKAWLAKHGAAPAAGPGAQ
ncbi:CopM family metallochaperone [Xanthobacter agilis]|uniref:Uncharacterized protein (DUF305 family) n=1 Tax=Xanthobacter agilis TaxID=47492 RepID=A0ABU0LC72_XANAG|nr:DUF305 domain-containing protein [Xanthobacter agilis]MDQ0504719.1 uncharacterized protein (DUF305 family) [Xanthobacter agilis]